MAYKTILVHIDASVRVGERIKIAADLAIDYKAHLIGLASTGLTQLSYLEGEVPGAYRDLVNSVSQKAKDSLSKFEDTARTSGIRSFEKLLVDEDAGIAICHHALYSDLVVIGQSDPAATASFVRTDFPEYVVLHSDRPVLVVPYTGHFSSVATKVVIAWDGSKEAMQAVVASIPFLQKAEEVRVVIYDPTAEQKEREPHIGNELAKYLARFDINVEILIQVSSRGLGNSLLSFAADCSADLIVMGAFVHSRYREMFLGGMTNTMLSDMTIPVLFAH